MATQKETKMKEVDQVGWLKGCSNSRPIFLSSSRSISAGLSLSFASLQEKLWDTLAMVEISGKWVTLQLAHLFRTVS